MKPILTLLILFSLTTQAQYGFNLASHTAYVASGPANVRGPHYRNTTVTYGLIHKSRLIQWEVNIATYGGLKIKDSTSFYSNYIQVPVMLNIPIGRLSLQAGGAYQYLFHAGIRSFWDKDMKLDWSTVGNKWPWFQQFDVIGLAGASYNLGNGGYATARLTRGLRNLRRDGGYNDRETLWGSKNASVRIGFEWMFKVKK